MAENNLALKKEKIKTSKETHKFMLKDFENWNKQKINLENLQNKNFVNERDVWFVYLGENIGSEQCGGRDFLRPVIILKVFKNRTFIAVPLTTKSKGEKYAIKFLFKERKQWALISQIRVLDVKRVKNKIGKINKEIFLEIARKQTESLLSSLDPEGRIEAFQIKK